MYIEKIRAFLPQYQNITKEDFILILKKSNTDWFDEFKLEKDFLLTLILSKFWKQYPELIFKWWTCLNKIYFPYFRLSEDLDFVINKNPWRAARKTLLKGYEDNFIQDLKILWLTLREERTKFDEHKLAMFTFEYQSILDDSIQTVKVDISLKASLTLPSLEKEIKAIYKDTVLEEIIFQNNYINCIDLKESVAEKIRAWLTRKTPAIRDFFDIRYIKHNSDFDFQDPELKKLIIKKLEDVNFEYTVNIEDIKNNDKINNYNLLKMQIETDLKPVLKDKFDFNLPAIYKFILDFKPSTNA